VRNARRLCILRQHVARYHRPPFRTTQPSPFPQAGISASEHHCFRSKRRCLRIYDKNTTAALHEPTNNETNNHRDSWRIIIGFACAVQAKSHTSSEGFIATIHSKARSPDRPRKDPTFSTLSIVDKVSSKGSRNLSGTIPIQLLAQPCGPRVHRLRGHPGLGSDRRRANRQPPARPEDAAYISNGATGLAVPLPGQAHAPGSSGPVHAPTHREAHKQVTGAGSSSRSSMRSFPLPQRYPREGASLQRLETASLGAPGYPPPLSTSPSAHRRSPPPNH
jgi:hypothetical protein